jgi:thiamine-monophosphate kinase
MNEKEMIRLFYDRPPLDDCFAFSDGRLVTTDTLVENTHFRMDWSTPEDLAIKLVEVNVSDILSSGGIPSHCLLNLGIPDDLSENWIRRFALRFRRQLQHHKIELVGGDTIRSPVVILSMTLEGKANQIWSRDGGKEGDFLYITDKPGWSEEGYQQLQSKGRSKISIHDKGMIKHLRPRTNQKAFNIMKTLNIHACMDLTDGLVQDLQRLSEASKVRLKVDIDKIIQKNLKLNKLTIDEILTSGEELEFLFLSPNPPEEVPFFWIGKAISGNGVRFLKDGVDYLPSSSGFTHFGGAS